MFVKKSIFVSTIIILFTIAIIISCFVDYGSAVRALTKPSIRLPIIMYHSVSKNSKSLGKFIISPKEFEEDVIYLKKQGYTTIGVEDLIAFEYNNVDLPEKPIMLTFDDGYSSIYTYIYPILKEYECKAVISIVGEYVDKSTKNPYPDPYINWMQVEEFINSKNIEIQNHTYSMHKLSKRKGCRIMKGESYEDYKEEILKDVGNFQLMIKEKTGYTPKAFTYPYGFSCKESRSILKEMGFLATFTCDIGINYLSGKTDELYELKRINRPSGINRAHFFSQLEN